MWCLAFSNKINFKSITIRYLICVFDPKILNEQKRFYTSKTNKVYKDFMIG